MGANVYLLAVGLPCIYPKVNVGVRRVLVNKARHSRLGEGLFKPLPRKMTNPVALYLLLKRHEASVVSASSKFLPFSCLGIHS
jgi:hypothetical protein